MSVASVNDLLEALKKATSKQVVTSFLKDRGLPSAASNWDDLLENRVSVALKDGSLTRGDLVSLICDAEEHGHQHVFLYRKKGRGGVSEEALQKWLQDAGDLALLDEPRYLLEPKQLTLCRVVTKAQAVKLTYATTHWSRSVVSEDEDKANRRLTITYAFEPVRQINVVRTLSTGLLEVRIGAHSSSSKYYREAVSHQLAKMTRLIAFSDYLPVDLTPAKDYIWSARHELHARSELIHNAVKSQDDSGATMSAASGNAKLSLLEAGQTDEAMTVFLRDGGMCQEANIQLLANETTNKAGVDRNLHVKIGGGSSNEFILGGRFSVEEYEYVLKKIGDYLKAGKAA